MPRRSAKPPYEIMSGGPGPSSSSSRSRPRKALRLPDFAWRDRLSDGWDAVRSAVARLSGLLASRGGSGGREALSRPWWITSSAPVTLRMSKGLIVGAVAGVVALVGLSFWAGLSQGRDAAEPVLTADQGPPDGGFVAFGQLGDDIPGGADGSVVPFSRVDTQTGELVKPQPVPTAKPDGDPRVAGLNYLVYITTVKPEAERLQGFLAEQGVVSIVVPVGGRELAEEAGSGHNARLYRVVDVSEGFTREQYRRGEHREFHNARLRLGQEWRRHNGHRGDDLSSMTFYKYTPRS